MSLEYLLAKETSLDPKRKQRIRSYCKRLLPLCRIVPSLQGKVSTGIDFVAFFESAASFASHR